MTIHETADRLRAHANATLPMAELREAARALFGKPDDRSVERLLFEAGYLLLARRRDGRIGLDPGVEARARRDAVGPITPEADIGQGPDVVAVEDGAQVWYVAPRGAMMRFSHWLAEQAQSDAAAPEG